MTLVLLHGVGGVTKMTRLLGLVGTLLYCWKAQADAAVIDRDAVVADQHHFPAATERAAVQAADDRHAHCFDQPEVVPDPFEAGADPDRVVGR